jgi:hypothetical protein
MLYDSGKFKDWFRMIITGPYTSIETSQKRNPKGSYWKDQSLELYTDQSFEPYYAYAFPVKPLYTNAASISYTDRFGQPYTSN